jgi:hypothetical protein
MQGSQKQQRQELLQPRLLVRRLVLLQVAGLFLR